MVEGFSTDNTEYISLVINNERTPYIAQDEVNGNKVTVKEFVVVGFV